MSTSLCTESFKVLIYEAKIMDEALLFCQSMKPCWKCAVEY